MVLSILIIDASRINASTLASSIMNSFEGSIKITKVSSDIGAFNLIKDGKDNYDVIFLDVIHNKKDGFKYAQNIRMMDGLNNVPIIFLTDNDFKGLVSLSHRDTNNYIMSLNTNKVEQNELHGFLRQLQDKTIYFEYSPVVFINHIQGHEIIKVEDIYFVEVKDKYLYIHIKGDKYICSRLGLSNFIEKCNVRYIRKSHRSFAVNTKKIKELEKIDNRLWKIKFECDIGDCYVSKTYYDEILRLKTNNNI